MKVKYDCLSRLEQSWTRLLWTQETDLRLFNLCSDRHFQSKSGLYLYVAYSIKVALDKRIVQWQAIAWRLLRQITVTSSLLQTPNYQSNFCLTRYMQLRVLSLGRPVHCVFIIKGRSHLMLNQILRKMNVIYLPNILTCVAWRFCQTHYWGAKPQKRARPSLLSVSLPSPSLACLRARPNPPFYAGYKHF